MCCFDSPHRCLAALKVPVELWSSYDVYLFPESNARPLHLKFWASDKDTAGDLAAFICGRLRARPRSAEYPVPAGPHELLITGSSNNPCMIRMVVPHTAPLRSSLDATKASHSFLRHWG